MIRTEGGQRSLALSLQVADDGMRVAYQLDGIHFASGETVARKPDRVAGIATVHFDEYELEIEDDAGPVPVRTESGSWDWAEGTGTCWLASRATHGQVRVAYPARVRTVDAAVSGGSPPIDLRIEAAGITGQGLAFLVLPPLEGPWDIQVSWAVEADRGQCGVCSLGAGDLTLPATPLEALLDCYFMVGAVTTVGHPRSQVTVHYLTRPRFDAEAFADRTARVHEALALAFQEDPPPFRVFLRRNPYRGLSGSALTHSFVVGWHEQFVDSAERLNAFIDHELVHEWVLLDGSYEEAVWYNEGLADYFGVVLPYRSGLISDDLFLSRVNLQARLGYASLYRNVPLLDLVSLYWDDFRAQQEPYYRGFFYFARLDFALRAEGRSGCTLGDLVQQVRIRRRSGELVRVDEWQAMIAAELGAVGRKLLDEILDGSIELPPATVWGEDFECFLDDAPVIDPGFEPITFITSIVTGLRPDGPAAQSGLQEGDALLEMPAYGELAEMVPGQKFNALIRRGNEEFTVCLRPGFETARVPSWRQV